MVNLQTRVRLVQRNKDDMCFHSYELFKSILTNYNSQFNLHHLTVGSKLKINSDLFSITKIDFILYSHLAEPSPYGSDYMAVEEPLAYNSELVLHVSEV